MIPSSLYCTWTRIGLRCGGSGGTPLRYLSRSCPEGRSGESGRYTGSASQSTDALKVVTTCWSSNWLDLCPRTVRYPRSRSRGRFPSSLSSLVHLNSSFYFCWRRRPCLLLLSRFVFLTIYFNHAEEHAAERVPAVPDRERATRRKHSVDFSHDTHGRVVVAHRQKKRYEDDRPLTLLTAGFVIDACLEPDKSMLHLIGAASMPGKKPTALIFTTSAVPNWNSAVTGKTVHRCLCILAA